MTTPRCSWSQFSARHPIIASLLALPLVPFYLLVIVLVALPFATVYWVFGVPEPKYRLSRDDLLWHWRKDCSHWPDATRLRRVSATLLNRKECPECMAIDASRPTGRSRWFAFSPRTLFAVVVYQVAVISFVATDGFADMYFLFGFDWNDAGSANVVHTSICWMVAELPLLAALGWWHRGKRHPEKSPATQADRP